jgi:hypothetical protein
MEPSKVSLNEKLLPSKDIFSRAELLYSLSIAYPHYKENDFSWIIAEFLREKIIFRVAYGRYSRKEAKTYSGGPTNPLVEQVRSLFLREKLRVPFVVFTSGLLNEGLNELIAHETLIVEVPSRSMEFAFSLLEKHFPRLRILYNPTLEERSHYSRGDSLVIFPLASRSPLSHERGKISLEKLIVDIFADRGLREFFSTDEALSLARTFLSSYSYDVQALFAYAKRRYVQKEIKSAIAFSSCPGAKFKEQ